MCGFISTSTGNSSCEVTRLLLMLFMRKGIVGTSEHRKVYAVRVFEKKMLLLQNSLLKCVIQLGKIKTESVDEISKFKIKFLVNPKHVIVVAQMQKIFCFCFCQSFDVKMKNDTPCKCLPYSRAPLIFLFSGRSINFN